MTDANQSPAMDFLHLPLPIIKDVLKNLNLRDLVNTAATCHAMADIVSSTDLGAKCSVRLIIKNVAQSNEASGFLNRI